MLLARGADEPITRANVIANSDHRIRKGTGTMRRLGLASLCRDC
jgi:hypothetical protein